ncbi:transport protein [Porcine lymphotropic herpesvirus 2]|uniref:Transport protein n=2 Tax=Suid gammaherpesvirus 4 TaxID=1960250 RepID=Q772U5_9GAMA|nr:transport protein [Porcine lymphotropic herpesvirus 2]AAO12280.1 transport protein [Porcine lymphotropic herpesvirus 2]AAO12352.1 transport protein [Porcine lymphotropic herpesvirus 2]
MTQHLAALYSQIYGVCLDVSILEYCDPSGVDKCALLNTKNKIEDIYDTVFDYLILQNRSDSSSLSLELEHLLANVRDRLHVILGALGDSNQYFSRLHLECKCNFHERIKMHFYNGCSIEVKMNLINDVEVFFKKLNSVFYCIPAEKAILCLQNVLHFLRKLRGISPVAPPDCYISSIPCLECFKEITMIPNQGKSIQEMLVNFDCPHICRPLNSEPVQGLFENELKHTGVNVTLDMKECPTDGASTLKIMEESLKCLEDHNIFTEIPKQMWEISNLIYWNSAEETTEKHCQCSQLTKILQRNAKMNQYRRILFKDNHFFDTCHPQSIELLFCGSLYSSTDDVIRALKCDCSATFMEQPKFQSMFHKRNELFTRLSNLLYENTTGGDDDHITSSMNSDVIRIEGMKESSNEQILEEARLRKEAYLHKVSKDGMKKLQACLDAHSNILKNILTLRVWGSTIYKEASLVLNHFLFRQRWVSDSTWMTDGGNTLFENSKFIKNSLYATNLSREHLDKLKLLFYSLINGPLTSTDDLFPIPQNVKLAHCLDSVNAMPHHKMMLVNMIHCQLEPKDWIDLKFNNFYTITQHTLNNIQYECWTYVRELVLSVSLYNMVWEKNVSIFRTDCDYRHCNPCTMNGIYITYEESAPLILIYNNRKWIFKDLYALLYTHLQMYNGR